MIIRNLASGVVWAAFVWGVSAGPVDAATRGTLRLMNKSHRPVTITLNPEWYNCYDRENGDTPLGTVWRNIAPGSHVELTYTRVDGHGCNGHQGVFELIFDPKIGVGERQRFDFDSEGHIEATHDPDLVNPYPGRFGTIDDHGRLYEYDCPDR